MHGSRNFLQGGGGGGGGGTGQSDNPLFFKVLDGIQHFPGGVQLFPREVQLFPKGGGGGGPTNCLFLKETHIL